MDLSSLVSRLTSASLRHWGSFLVAALGLTVAGAVLASRLDIRTSFAELLPPDAPSVRNARELARRLGGDGTVLVNVESLSGPRGLAAAEAMAARLGEEYRALGPGLVRSVDWDLSQVERWYADHWPLFLELSELQEARDALVRAIGQAKARANPLLTLDDEAPDQAAPDVVSVPLLDPGRESPRAQVEERFSRYPDGFMAHPDRRSVTIVVRPTGTSLGVAESRRLLERMRAVADAHHAAQLRVGFAGTFPAALAGYESIVHDVLSTFALVLGAVFLSLVLFYRDVRPALALAAVVLVAVALTFGLTRLAIGHLNTLTAFFGSIVAGNGINYGLVYLARVGQLRRRGVGLEAACHEGAELAARATLLGAAGTSVSFGALLAASNRGFRHFGFIGGLGMLLCWAATFALVPALLALFERIRPLRHEGPPRAMRAALPLLGREAFARPRALVAAFVLAAGASSAAFVWRLPDAMERDLDRLTTDVKRDPALKRDDDRAGASLGQAVGGAVALLPSREAADAYCDAIRARVREQPRLRELVESCQTLSSVVPPRQAEKLRLIAEIRGRLTERLLGRLPARQARRAAEIRAQLGAQGPLDARDAPPSLVDRFREVDGTLGRLAFVRDRPTANLQLGPNLQDFVAGVRDVPVAGRRYDATGETVVVADLLATTEREGPLTTLLAFLGVSLAVLLTFRSAAHGGALVLSLAIGVMLMAGLATLAGLRINFFNYIVYPITFGIAIDYGANVLARVAARGEVLPALLEVGPAVALCSWTTIVGYGSLTLAANGALSSFGRYAALGEVAAIATALTFLPALALVLGRRAR